MPIFYDWLKNKDNQLFSEVKKFSKWKVKPVIDEDTMKVIKKGVKNPRPKYYKEKDKMIKEAKKKFTELHKKYKFATPHREFTLIQDGILQGRGYEPFGIKRDEKQIKEFFNKRKIEREQIKKEKSENIEVKKKEESEFSKFKKNEPNQLFVSRYLASLYLASTLGDKENETMFKRLKTAKSVENILKSKAKGILKKKEALIEGLKELVDIANNKTLGKLKSEYDLEGEDDMDTIYDIGSVGAEDIVFLLDLAEKYVGAKVSYQMPEGQFDANKILVKVK